MDPEIVQAVVAVIGLFAGVGIGPLIASAWQNWKKEKREQLNDEARWLENNIKELIEFAAEIRPRRSVNTPEDRIKLEELIIKAHGHIQFIADATGDPTIQRLLTELDLLGPRWQAEWVYIALVQVRSHLAKKLNKIRHKLGLQSIGGIPEDDIVEKSLVDRINRLSSTNPPLIKDDGLKLQDRSDDKRNQRQSR